VEESGVWSGMVGQAARGEADIIISDIFITYTRSQMFDGTITFDRDFITFVSPLPYPIPKFLALIQPFHYFVWSCIVSSFFLAPIAFRCIMMLVERIQERIECNSYFSSTGPIMTSL
jgi:hypothetical protein